ncbi:MAG TPA: hypothetical protein VE033_15820 [Acetobacteraceae bacterium]|jgi:hypothetical protein|nr:hypothetical protein [Acetobacteraceae bacterium]
MSDRDQRPRHGDPTEIDPRPTPGSDRGPGSTVAQLKQDITSGATGDKVAVFDPGMANVGVGGEASGTPMTPEMVELARKTERMTKPPPGDPGVRSSRRLGPFLLGVLVVAVAAGIGAIFLG